MVRDQAQSKILLVTADDFGMCAAVTDGILDAHRHGIVRATSLFVVGEDAERAAACSRAAPELRVGVHLALVDGRPLSPAAEVGSLVDGRGAFADYYVDFVRRYINRRIKLPQIYREWRAQIARARALGIAPAHLDSHQHLHLLPGLFEIAVRLCQEFGIPRLRVPISESATGKIDWQSYARPGSAALQLLSLRAKRALRKRPEVRMCQRFLGRQESCRLSEEALLMLIDKVQPGTQELMCHPGQPEPAALLRHPFGANWGVELQALKSPSVHARIAERGIVLRGSL
jgi:predicted glycoside hydrolase/deacetylase ChbG (UPF0249 family)